MKKLHGKPAMLRFLYVDQAIEKDITKVNIPFGMIYPGLTIKD